MTTIETLAVEQIESLRSAAGQAGDSKQVELCDAAEAYVRAMAQEGFASDADWVARGEDAARECVAVIRLAEANQADRARGSYRWDRAD